MKQEKINSLAFVLVILPSITWSKPEGAPYEACPTMIPLHGDKMNYTYGNENSPYEFVLKNLGNRRVRVAIKSKKNCGPFQGK